MLMNDMPTSDSPLQMGEWLFFVDSHDDQDSEAERRNEPKNSPIIGYFDAKSLFDNASKVVHAVNVSDRNYL